MFGIRTAHAKAIEKIKNDAAETLATFRDAFSAAAEKGDPAERYITLWELETKVDNQDKAFSKKIADSVRNTPLFKKTAIGALGTGFPMVGAIFASFLDGSISTAEMAVSCSLAAVTYGSLAIRVADQMHENKIVQKRAEIFFEQFSALEDLKLDIRAARKALPFENQAAFAASPYFPSALVATPELAQEWVTNTLKQKQEEQKNLKNQIKGFQL